MFNRAFLILFLVFALVGCSSLHKPTSQITGQSNKSTGIVKHTRPTNRPIPFDELKTIRFDYNQYTLRSDQMVLLFNNVGVIKRHPGLKISLEGHADERGTKEYNFILAQKRAMTVREFLIKHGIPQDRLHILSFGEDQPIDLGHNETAWSRNRRVDFNVFM